MVVRQGDVAWAELPEADGSDPGFRRPVVVIQGNPLNSSRLSTVVCIPLTGNLPCADASGCVLLKARTTGLPRDSVANASQVIAIDRAFLTDLVGHLPPGLLSLVFAGLHVVLGR